MTTTTAMSTDEVLAAMLTENTGRHMLDSGGAYGRNFERQAGMTVEDFRARPEITVEYGKRFVDGKRTDETVVDWITLDVFHFLRQRVEYAPDLDAAFREFATAPEREREPWFACLDEWFREVEACAPEGWDHKGVPWVVNTYNGEDDLSQVVQYAMFRLPHAEDPDQVYCALAIHGGCDVRGGYTAPRMFTVAEMYDLCDNADHYVYLAEPDRTPPEGHDPLPLDLPPVYPRSLTIDFRGGYGERNPEPWDDPSMEHIDFIYGETPVVLGEDGRLRIASGPAEGWTVDFGPPFPC